MASQKRKNHRFPVRGTGRILYGRDFAQEIDCVIADRSASGAKLQVAKGSVVPAEFVLVDQLSRTCSLSQVVRREPYAVGIRFLRVLDPDGASALELGALWPRVAEALA